MLAEIADYNKTETAYPRESTIAQLFEQQAARTPDTVAVVSAGRSLTYRELDQSSNQLARHLQQFGVQRETLVGIAVERSVEMMVGLLAILIKSLIASVSRAFPIGALMSLQTGGSVNFKPRPVEGTPSEAKQATPVSLLLDGPQRMTSLYQSTLRAQAVDTVTAQNKKVKRWFYIDIRKTLDPSADREEAIVGVPEGRVNRTNFARDVVLDLSSPEREYALPMYPVHQVFDWDRWQDGFDKHWRGDQNESIREEFRAFKRQVLENFKYYRVPVITGTC